MVSKKLLWLAMAAACISGSAMAKSTTIDQAKDMKSADVIEWWGRANKACNADTTGGIIQACLDRTDLADVLEKRGLCLSITNGGGWHTCLVGGGGGMGESGGPDSNVGAGSYANSPAILKTNRDNNSYSTGTRGSDRQDVSPIQ